MKVKTTTTRRRDARGSGRSKMITKVISGSRSSTLIKPGGNSNVRARVNAQINAKTSGKRKTGSRTGSKTSSTSRDSKTRNSRAGQKKNVNPYVSCNGKPAPDKKMLYIGVSSMLGALLLVLTIVIIVTKEPDNKISPPKVVVKSNKTHKSKRHYSNKGHYGAKYSEYDPQMVMSEEATKFARDRKARMAKARRY